MTREQIDAIPRKEARQLFDENPTRDNNLLIAVEQALSLEWWRGYHAAIRTTAEQG